MSRTTFGSLPWRSSSQHVLAAKSCPVHNFFIWSHILKLCHIIDLHIESLCREQHLGSYIEGQGHSMTLHQKRVRPITSLFEVWFYNYLTEMITILKWRVAHNIWVATLKVKVTAWPCIKIVSGPNFIWRLILQLLLTNYFSVSNTYLGSITRFRPALVFFILDCPIFYMLYLWKWFLQEVFNHYFCIGNDIYWYA